MTPPLIQGTARAVTCRYTIEGHRRRSHVPTCTDRHCPGCEPCLVDALGIPVRHCRTRRACTSHLGYGEYVCPTCLAKLRTRLVDISGAVASMADEALHAGVDSEAADLAGPTASVVWSRWRRSQAAKAGTWIEETDWTDPHIALGEWERIIREDLGHDSRTLVSATLGRTLGYLDWALSDLARDEQRAMLVSELLRCAESVCAHLERVLHAERGPELGAECPACPATPQHPAPRLRRRWAHWCEQEDCTRQHDLSGSRDTWVCPADSGHWWSEAEYRKWVSEDYRANAGALTAEDMETEYGIKPGSLRAWASRGRVSRRARDHRGRVTYDVAEAKIAARAAVREAQIRAAQTACDCANDSDVVCLIRGCSKSKGLVRPKSGPGQAANQGQV